MTKIETYTKKEAISLVRKMRKTGWALAHIVAQPQELYTVVTHSRNCRCGMCPIVRIDGIVG